MQTFHYCSEFFVQSIIQYFSFTHFHYRFILFFFYAGSFSISLYFLIFFSYIDGGRMVYYLPAIHFVSSLVELSSSRVLLRSPLILILLLFFCFLSSLTPPGGGCTVNEMNSIRLNFKIYFLLLSCNPLFSLYFNIFFQISCHLFIYLFIFILAFTRRKGAREI